MSGFMTIPACHNGSDQGAAVGDIRDVQPGEQTHRWLRMWLRRANSDPLMSRLAEPSVAS
jgi:hypothetical protein